MPQFKSTESSARKSSNGDNGSVIEWVMQPPTPEYPGNRGLSHKEALEYAKWLSEKSPDTPTLTNKEMMQEAGVQDRHMSALILGNECRYPFPDIKDILAGNIRLQYLDDEADAAVIEEMKTSRDSQGRLDKVQYLWLEEVGGVTLTYRKWTSGMGLWAWTEKVMADLLLGGATEHQISEVWPDTKIMASELLPKYLKACDRGGSKFPGNADSGIIRRRIVRDILASHEWDEQGRVDGQERDSSDRRKLQQIPFDPKNAKIKSKMDDLERRDEALCVPKIERSAKLMAKEQDPQRREKIRLAAITQIERHLHLPYTTKDRLMGMLEEAKIAQSA